MSHDEDDKDEALVTMEGEVFPKDIADRDAETMRVMDEEEVHVDGDCDADEAVVKARRSPTEPTEEERLRHEATHVPYR